MQSQQSLIATNKTKQKTTHDDAGNKKQKAGKSSAVDPAKSDERSWIQARTAELVIEKHPDGNSFTNELWSSCYKQAKKEWTNAETDRI